MIVFNHGDTPIFISTSIKADPFGGAGEMENKVIVMPGDGIDLDILNLKLGSCVKDNQEKK